MSSLVISPFPSPSPSQRTFRKNGIKKWPQLILVLQRKQESACAVRRFTAFLVLRARIPAQEWHEFSSVLVGQERLKDCIWITLAAVIVHCAHHLLFSNVTMCFNFSSSAGKRGMVCSSSVTVMHFFATRLAAKQKSQFLNPTWICSKFLISRCSLKGNTSKEKQKTKKTENQPNKKTTTKSGLALKPFL